MRYDYLVKHNGIWYEAGEEVPDGTSPVTLTDDVPDGALETHEDGSVDAFDENNNFVGTVDAETVEEALENVADEAPVVEPETEKEYGRSDITRMNKDGLVELAKNLEIEFTDKTSGADLKELILAKLEL